MSFRALKNISHSSVIYLLFPFQAIVGIIQLITMDLNSDTTISIAALVTQSWNTFAEAKKAVYNAAAFEGFGLAKKRSSNKDSQVDTGYRYHVFICDCGDNSGSRPEPKGLKAFPTAKTNCTFSCIIKWLRQDAQWVFCISKGLEEHNHTFSSDPWSHANFRRELRCKPDVLAAIQNLSSLHDLTAEAIARQIRVQFGDEGLQITRQDVINEVKKQRAIIGGGYSQTQLFVEDLQVKSAWHRIYRSDESESGALECIFWTYPWCIEIWRLNPDVILLDSTYRVNK